MNQLRNIRLILLHIVLLVYSLMKIVMNGLQRDVTYQLKVTLIKQFAYAII